MNTQAGTFYLRPQLVCAISWLLLSVHRYRYRERGALGGLVVPPLAIFALELFDVGDTRFENRVGEVRTSLIDVASLSFAVGVCIQYLNTRT